jgi:hypothetical protein
MHTIEIPAKNEMYFMPSEMHELNTRQYIALCHVLYLLEHSKISNEEAEMRLLLAFAEIKLNWRYALMSKRKKMLVHENLNQLLPLIKTVFEERQLSDGQTAMVPSLAFVDNKIRRYQNLIGPDDALQNCTFFEYKEAYAQWYQYQENQNEDHLNEMIAILYRPVKSFLQVQKRMKNFNGDSRETYNVVTNPRKLQNRIRKVEKWPSHIKYGIWLWFTACMEFLRTGKPVIDGIEIDLAILYKGEDGASAGIGLTGILYSLAETGVFGGIRETGDSNLYDVLARLYQVKLQMKAKQKEK